MTKRSSVVQLQAFRDFKKAEAFADNVMGKTCFLFCEITRYETMFLIVDQGLIDCLQLALDDSEVPGE